MTEPTMTPAEAWARMSDGNRRFVGGSPEHPRQDAERRAQLASAQMPIATLFGCSDSRLAAEIIFDVGLGDLFVIRNAGQVVDDTVLGTIEFAVAVLKTPLIVVLGHDNCGAVKAATETHVTGERVPMQHLAGLLDRIEPVFEGLRPVFDGSYDLRDVGRAHLQATLQAIHDESSVVADGVAAGTLALVSANYELANGIAQPHAVIGDITPR